MKLSLIFLAGALPLCLMTINFFLPVPEKANVEAVVEPALLDTKAIQAMTDSQSADLAKEGVGYVDRLRQVDLFAAREIPPTLVISAPTTQTGKNWYSAAFEGWENARKTQTGVTKFVTLASTKSVRPAQEVLGEMKQFASAAGANNPLNGVHGAPGFVNFVDVLCGQLNSQHESEEQLKKADQLLAQENYSGCLIVLKSVNRTGLGGLPLKAYQECERKALLGKWWTEKPKTTGTTKAASEERRSWRRRCPEALLVEEKQKLDQLDKELALADCDLDRDQLRSNPPATATEYLRKANGIIKNCPDTQSALRSSCAQWLSTKLPILAGNERAKLLSEAERINGKLISGVFRPSIDKKTGKTTFYMYWLSSGEFQKRGINDYNDLIYPKVNIKDEPRDSFYMRATVEFNDARKKLLARWESEAEWRDFAAVCDRLDRDYKQYCDRGGMIELERATGGTLAELKFQDAASLAAEMLSEWDAVKTIVGE